MLAAPAPPFERVEDVVRDKTLDTVVNFIIMITDHIVGPKTPAVGLDCHGLDTPNNFKKIKLILKNAHRSAFDIQF